MYPISNVGPISFSFDLLFQWFFISFPFILLGIYLLFRVITFLNLGIKALKIYLLEKEKKN